jgi:hypothetical protein
MVLLAASAPVAVPALSLPDLNARLHPSDGTPWTILFVLTLITLLPAILMCMTPMVRSMFRTLPRRWTRRNRTKSSCRANCRVA